MTRHFIRALWVFGGIVFLILGAIGIILPLLPTTPFLLLAAFCFARGSEKMNNWLLNHRIFGPPIRNWRDYGAVSAKAKNLALMVMAPMAPAAYLLGAPLWAIGIQSSILIAVAIFIWTRPVPPK